MERELDMQVGMLSYHLRVLVEAGMVRSEPEGNHVRYFPVEGFIMADRRAMGFLRNRSTRGLLLHLLDRGEVSFSELLSLAGLSKSTLSYHLKRMSAASLISVTRGEAMTVRLSDPEKVANLLVWVREDVERDAVDSLIQVWDRLSKGH